jgi:hypothetical protein
MVPPELCGTIISVTVTEPSFTFLILTRARPAVNVVAHNTSSGWPTAKGGWAVNRFF